MAEAAAAPSKIRDGLTAVRLPFTVVSIMPFVAGSLLASEPFRASLFFLGLTTVLATHLSSNVINDYADSRSGADWGDRKHYGMFGGSKLIQSGRLSEKFFLRLAIALAASGAACIAAMTIITRDPIIPAVFILFLALGWFYTLPPLKLSYHRLGEATLFLLCGPAVAAGGWYIQTGELSSIEPWTISVLFGFMIAIVLFMNQTPDLPDDVRAGKRTLVSLVGANRAWIFYSALIIGVYGSLVICVLSGILGIISLMGFAAFPLAAWSARRLAVNYDDKIKLLSACKTTLLFYIVVALFVLLDIAIFSA